MPKSKAVTPTMRRIMRLLLAGGHVWNGSHNRKAYLVAPEGDKTEYCRLDTLHLMTGMGLLETTTRGNDTHPDTHWHLTPAAPCMVRGIHLAYYLRPRGRWDVDRPIGPFRYNLRVTHEEVRTAEGGWIASYQPKNARWLLNPAVSGVDPDQSCAGFDIYAYPVESGTAFIDVPKED